MEKLIINSKDNVGICLDGCEDIPAGHKFALRNIKRGEYIIKYGEIIGRATNDISEGEWIHTHNVMTHLDENMSYEYDPMPKSEFNTDAVAPKSFKGYVRAWGEVGIRNDIYIIPTVGCVNNVCKQLEKRAQSLVCGSIDGIFALTHPFGCSQLSEDAKNIKKLLCDIALHPNASYVLFVGLGCENNSLAGIKEYITPYNRDNIAYFNCQDVENEEEYGFSILEEFAKKASSLQRESVSVSKLTIGLKCGGSDGYSGITANPLIGKICDRLVSLGGSAILTEVPEMFGAEHILMNRCKNREVYSKYIEMIENFKAYYKAQGMPIYENPSPGNKAGGITTLEEKSLGCIKKAGDSTIVDVLGYGDLKRENGLSVLNAPGNDLIASTALAAAGCHMVLFTTGRGTPFSAFVPTLKIASNKKIAEKKSGWIDFCAYDMDENAFWELILKCASGEYRCHSEQEREIAFFKTGVTL